MAIVDLSCPLCATPLSETRFAEIQHKVREEERARYENLKAKLHAESDRRLKAAVQQAETKAGEDAKKQASVFNAERAKLADEKKVLLEREAALIRGHQNDLQQRVKAAEQAVRAAVNEEVSALRLSEVQMRDLVAKLQEREATLSAEKAQAIKTLAEGHARELTEAKQAGIRDASAQWDRQRAEFEQKSKAQSDAVAGLQSEVLRTQQDADARLAAAVDVKEREHLAELARQRSALDQAKTDEIRKIRFQVAEQNEALRKKLAEAEKKLEQKAAHDLGHWPEVELATALREAFPEDQIEKIKSGEPGVDVVHTVRYKGVACGRIVIDSKNRQQWRESYVEKLAQDRLNADAQHAILSTSAFPAGCRDLSLRSDVILAKPNQVVAIVDLLRRTLISNYIVGLSLADEGRKKDQLYKLITSDVYRQYFRTAERLCSDLQQVDVDELAAHQKVWEKRGKMQRQMDRVLRDINASIADVIEHPNALGAAEVVGLAEARQVDGPRKPGTAQRH